MASQPYLMAENLSYTVEPTRRFIAGISHSLVTADRISLV